MTVAQKFSRLQKRGQVTIPIEIRQRLGLEEGDLVAFYETDSGIVISPQEIVPTQKLNQLLEDRGVGLEDLFAFADRIAPDKSVADETIQSKEKKSSVTEGTAGIFQRLDRSQPDNFKQLRETFIDETAKSVMTEARTESG